MTTRIPCSYRSPRATKSLKRLQQRAAFSVAPSQSPKNVLATVAVHAQSYNCSMLGHNHPINHQSEQIEAVQEAAQELLQCPFQPLY